MDSIIEKIHKQFPVAYNEFDIYCKTQGIETAKSMGNDLYWIGPLVSFFNHAQIDFPLGSLDTELILNDVIEVLQKYEDSSTHYS
jgi:hypothetical protein